MSVYGRGVPVHVYWEARAPSRAAAALLAAALRHALRLARVRLRPAPGPCRLAASLRALDDTLDQNVDE